MKKAIFVFLMGLSFSACQQNDKQSQQAQENPYEATRIALEAELDSIQQNGLLNGFSVAIVSEKGSLYEKGFGYADIETKEKYTEHTIQHIASVSKTLIGIALMKAQEEGKLLLDDPIQQYLSFKVVNPRYPADEITIRQLATHTSSIRDSDQYMG